MDIMKSLATVVGISLLITIGLYIFPSIIFLFPVAFIVVGVKYDLANSFISILITSFLIGISIDLISGLIILAVFGPMALYITDSIDKRKKSRDIIIPSSVIFFISAIIVFLMLRGFSGVSLVESLEESAKTYTDLQMTIIEDLELTNIESFRLKEEADRLYNYVISILPAIFIIFSAVISYMNYYVSTAILRRLGLGIRDNPRFSKFSLPRNFIVGSLFMFLLVYLLGNIETISADVIQLNIIVLVISLLFIQGLSVLDYLLVSLRFHFIFRLILLGLTVFVSPLMSLLFVIGVLDIIFDFRKLRRQKS